MNSTTSPGSSTPNSVKSEMFVNVRRLVALDMARSPKLILTELAFAVCLCTALSIFVFLHSSNPSPFTIFLGCFFLWVALNYLPLLLYGILLIRSKDTHQEFELADKATYARKYMLQSVVLLLIPLVLPMLAVYQELKKHSRPNGS